MRLWTGEHARLSQSALADIYDNTANCNESTIKPAILSLVAVLANDTKLYSVAMNSGGEIKLCKALQERDAELFAKIAERDSTIAEKDSTIEEMHSE